jgi:hypothetical protein
MWWMEINDRDWTTRWLKRGGLLLAVGVFGVAAQALHPNLSGRHAFNPGIAAMCALAFVAGFLATATAGIAKLVRRVRKR